MQLGRVELAHGLGDAQEPRVAHLQDLSNGHALLVVIFIVAPLVRSGPDQRG
jgi:hypothetical protein